MVARATRRSFTFREYLELEEASNTKHEFYAGEIYAMAGGTPAHAALAMTIGAELLTALRGSPCRVYSADLRVRVMATGLTSYPDISVVCGDVETDPESDVTVTNPSVLVEILSPSTEAYDRGEKLEHYQQIPALSACVLVSQTEREITVVERGQDGTWVSRTARAGDRVQLSAPEVAFNVDAVYDDAGVAPTP